MGAGSRKSLQIKFGFGVIFPQVKLSDDIPATDTSFLSHNIMVSPCFISCHNAVKRSLTFILIAWQISCLAPPSKKAAEELEMSIFCPGVRESLSFVRRDLP